MLNLIQSDECIESLIRKDLLAELRQDNGSHVRRQIMDALLEYEVLLRAELASGLTRETFVVRQQLLDAVRVARRLIDTHGQQHDGRT